MNDSPLLSYRENSKDQNINNEDTFEIGNNDDQINSYLQKSKSKGISLKNLGELDLKELKIPLKA